MSIKTFKLGKEQKELETKTFCFDIECNSEGIKEIMKTMSRMLNSTNWVYSNLRIENLIE